MSVLDENLPHSSTDTLSRLSCPSPLSSPRLGLSSSANEVWNIVELRLRIFDYITDRNDLVRLMRVERKAMAVVAGRLYEKISYDFVCSGISESVDRKEMYLDAIKVIDASDFRSHFAANAAELKAFSNPPSASSTHPGADLKSRIEAQISYQQRLVGEVDQLRTWLGIYNAELLKKLLPLFRQACPNLRKIIFGPDYRHLAETSSWVVELDQNDDSAHDDAGIGSGHITHVGTRSYAINKMPPTTMDLKHVDHAPPSDSYTIINRFDLCLSLNGSPLSPINRDRWLRAPERDPWYANLYQAVDFGPLPITLPILTTLYQRQIDANHAERLRVVLATHIAPFNMKGFAAFANVAAFSLTRLVIAKSRASGQTSTLAPPQLEGFIHIIHRYLPNLTDLEFRLEKAGEAEEYYQNKLPPLSLRPRGKIVSLRMHTGPSCPAAPLNLLRMLSSMAAENASVVQVGRQWDVDMTRHLVFLRRGPSNLRRVFLSNIDFSHLNIGNFLDLSLLTYKTPELPQHPLAGCTAGWLDDAKSSSSLPIETIQAAERSLDVLDHATRQLLLLSYSQQEQVRKKRPIVVAEVEAHIMDNMARQLHAVRGIEALCTAEGISALAGRTGDTIEMALKVRQDAVKAAEEKAEEEKTESAAE